MDNDQFNPGGTPPQGQSNQPPSGDSNQPDSNPYGPQPQPVEWPPKQAPLPQDQPPQPAPKPPQPAPPVPTSQPQPMTPPEPARPQPGPAEPHHGVTITPPAAAATPDQTSPEPVSEPATPAAGSQEAAEMARAKIAGLNDVYHARREQLPDHISPHPDQTQTTPSEPVQPPSPAQPPQPEPAAQPTPPPPQPAPPPAPIQPQPVPQPQPQPQPPSQPQSEPSRPTPSPEPQTGPPLTEPVSEPETPDQEPAESFDDQLKDALERNRQLAGAAETPTGAPPQPMTPPEPARPQPGPAPSSQQFGTFQLPPQPAPQAAPPEPVQPPSPAQPPQPEPAAQPTPPPPQPAPTTQPTTPPPQPAPAAPEMIELNKPVKPSDVVNNFRSYARDKISNYADFKNKVPSGIRTFLVAAAIGLGIFLAFNSQIIFGQIEYLTNAGVGEETPVITEATPTIAVGPQSRIIIPKINVNVPVVYDEKSFDERKVQQALERGVVHYGNTALPGQPGNNVIVGHSSNNWWASGKYKFAFVLLDKLAIGDTFAINYNSKQYIYEVFAKKIVEPDDLSVIEQTAEPITTLITCTPPGTSWNRLIVQARQISPEPTVGGATEQVPAENIESPLPGNPPSLWDKIRDWLFGSA